MKVVASATRGKKKTALGMDVTGAYSTLWNSKEGRKAKLAAVKNNDANYFPILAKLTGGNTRPDNPNRMDPVHPKVRLVVETALRLWERDEKSLIFCFRIPTAQVLRDLIEHEIEKRIRKARSVLLRGTQASDDVNALAQFKRSLTARTGSVIPAFMDRVVLGLAQIKVWPAMQFDVPDLQEIARLASRTYLKGKPAIRDLRKPDRVLLSRICEHVLAKKYLAVLAEVDSEAKGILERVSKIEWINTRYGLGSDHGDTGEDAETEAADVLTRSSLSVSYEVRDETSDAIYSYLFRTFNQAYLRQAGGLLNTLVFGPNLFVPGSGTALDDKARGRTRDMTRMLWDISRQVDGIDWEQRGQVVDAINRAFLRDHFLFRLPRDVFSGKDDLWSEALVRGFHEPLFGKDSEPVASKVVDFLSGLVQMTKEERQHSLKYSLNTQAKAVVLVSGPTKERDSVFRGFNSPLLPEILICTEVGQEGIDLHRHCRHVVHYDLGWNPAKIEQRTGRLDRIGSKTQRERNLILVAGQSEEENALIGLEVALPYLAATYDERMFDRLFARAQAFDLLTGGDASAEEDEERRGFVEDIAAPDGKTNLVVLPESLRQALRVDLRASKQALA